MSVNSAFTTFGSTATEPLDREAVYTLCAVVVDSNNIKTFVSVTTNRTFYSDTIDWKNWENVSSNNDRHFYYAANSRLDKVFTDLNGEYALMCGHTDSTSGKAIIVKYNTLNKEYEFYADLSTDNAELFTEDISVNGYYGYDGSMNQNGEYVVVSGYSGLGSGCMFVFRRTGDTYVLHQDLSSSAVSAAGAVISGSGNYGRWCSISPDGQYITTCGNGSNYNGNLLVVFKRNENNLYEFFQDLSEFVLDYTIHSQAPISFNGLNLWRRPGATARATRSSSICTSSR